MSHHKTWARQPETVFIAGSCDAPYAARLEFDVDLSDFVAGAAIEIEGPDGTVYELTCVASGAVAADGEFNAGTNDTTGATEIAAAFNALAGLTDLVTASVVNTDNVLLVANDPGVEGNSIVVTDVQGTEGFENGGNPSSSLAGGTGGPTTYVGRGFTVSKIGTGQYRIAITSHGERLYPRILSAVVSLLIAADDWKVKLIAIDAANGHVDVETVNATAAADMTTGELHFVIAAQNSGVA